MANQIEELEKSVKGTFADGDFHFDHPNSVLRINSLFSRWSTSAMAPLALGLLGLIATGVTVFVASSTVMLTALGLSVLMFVLFGLTFANPGFVIDFRQRQVRYRKHRIPFDRIRREQFSFDHGDYVRLSFHGPGFKKHIAEFKTSETQQAYYFQEHLLRLFESPDMWSVFTYGSKLTPVQWWIQGVSAVFTVDWGMPLGELGDFSGPFKSLGRTGISRALERDWGIRDREGMVAQIESLARDGHREQFAQAGIPGKYLAWDYARALWMQRMGFILGWFDEEYCWDTMLPLARDVQRHYSGWAEMNHWYLEGRRLWSAAVSDGKPDPVQAQRERTAERLAADPKCPWNFLPWDLPLHRDW
ncbi:DUF1266 domain-containing protein [Stackebrandtia nassauensis]|uniref:DUF1266 domain-containing protein n=1 Tax=Stackebrandtia nassauensis (strain DSM 44728 / CIP 108903 / NRRL B-16338 / NBRC 102104 / LLR-40K-21) TaxID=446470 RepID=D3PYB4_STANL|nr:DUF1266 domain-containing protein [Stackebrandtia nassauensis]ADD41481.1 hypothetical protein Snas_1784 [Stackebrandtia nassauensis DSM 44728]